MENGLTTSYGYNAVNELTSSTGTAYTYDARGNLTTKVKGADTWSYTYDKANRLLEAKKNNATLGIYTYDANGIRAKKVEHSETTIYLALGHKVLYEKTGTIATKHIFAGSQRIAEVKDGVVTYFHNDRLSSSRAVTNATGVLTAVMATKPFGEPHTTNAPTDYLFTGKELDDTSLYYFAARYYDPSVGRFATEDTWEGRLHQPASQNRYVYVLNNPLRYVDPTGHWDVDLICSGGGAAAIGAATSPGDPVAAIKSLVDGLYYVGVHIVSGISQRMVDVAAAIVDAISGESNNARRARYGSGGNSASPDPFEPSGRTVREQLLEVAENKSLRNAVDQLYRPTAKIGDGGTADAIRNELTTGQFVQHAQKGYDYVKNLQKILRTEQLSPSDRAIAVRLLNDLQNALEGLKR